MSDTMVPNESAEKIERLAGDFRASDESGFFLLATAWSEWVRWEEAAGQWFDEIGFVPLRGGPESPRGPGYLVLATVVRVRHGTLTAELDHSGERAFRELAVRAAQLIPRSVVKRWAVQPSDDLATWLRFLWGRKRPSKVGLTNVAGEFYVEPSWPRPFRQSETALRSLSSKPKRRSVRTRTVGLTEREHAAWMLFEGGDTRTEVGRKLEISRQSASAAIKRAKRKIAAATDGRRPSPKASRLPEDSRGQPNIPAN